jgi:serine/threonine protein kinase
VYIAREIAGGLAAAHERGLIHRDVKPANVFPCRMGTAARPSDSMPDPSDSQESVESADTVLLERDSAAGTGKSAHPTGSVKLMDFGLARTVEPTSFQTQAGTVLGTPHYMAPEQIEGRDVDPRADLFSLGCVLYRMTTGRLPFDGPSHMAVFVAVTRDTPPNVRHLNPAVPPALAELIEQLLEKQPDRRPQSAAEVAQRLGAICSGSPHRSTHDSVTPPVSSDPVVAADFSATILIQRSKFGKGAVAVGAMTLLALLIAVVAWKWPDNRAGDAGSANSSNGSDRERGPISNTSATPQDLTKPLWQPGPNDIDLHGLVAYPASLPGVRRWQIETIQPRGQLGDLQWSPDGKWLAMADSRQLRIYEFADGELTLNQLWSAREVIASLSWSPDSERIAASSDSRSARPNSLQVWNVPQRSVEQAAPLPGYFSTRISWSPDGNWLAVVGPVGGAPGKLRLYRMPDLELQSEWESSFKNLRCVCWTPDSSTIAIGGEFDPSVELWKLDGAASRHQVFPDGGVTTVSWSPDGKWLAAGGSAKVYTGGVQLLSPTGEMGSASQRFHGHAMSLSWSPGSSQLAVGGVGVWLWENLQEPQCRPLTPWNNNSWFLVAWHREGRFAALGQTHSTRLWLYDTTDPAKPPRPVIDSHPFVGNLSITRSDGRLAFGASDLSVRAQQADGTFRVVIQHRLTGAWRLDPPFDRFNFDDVPFVAWTASGRTLASQLSARDSSLRVWDAQQPESPARSIPVGQFDHRRMVARGENLVRGFGGLHELDLATGDIKQRWPFTPGDYFTISPDGELAAIHRGQGKVTILRLADSSEVTTIESPGAIQQPFSWSKDGRLLAISVANWIDMWNTRSWERIWRTPSHYYPHPAIAPDGRAVLATDGIHDIETGELIHTFSHPSENYDGGAWYPDSQHLATGMDTFVAIRSATDASIDRTVIPLRPDHTLVFDAAGNLEQGDLYLLDRDCICIVERDDGSRDLLRPSEFLKRIGLTAWPTTTQPRKPQRPETATGPR